MSKFLSRKLVVSFLFGVLVPVGFHQLGISEQITMFSMGLAAAYLGANAVSKKIGTE